MRKKVSLELSREVPRTNKIARREFSPRTEARRILHLLFSAKQRYRSFRVVTVSLINLTLALSVSTSRAPYHIDRNKNMGKSVCGKIRTLLWNE